MASSTANFYPRSPCGERPLALLPDGTMVFISIHALLAESDCDNTYTLGITDISIHALLAESDHVRQSSRCGWVISIHALLAESDLCHHMSKNAAIGFLSTLSLRRATGVRRGGLGERSISIHALLAESDRLLFPPGCLPCISIHALLAESDSAANFSSGKSITISIHALLAESDYTTWLPAARQNVFLSTLSLRRAT